MKLKIELHFAVATAKIPWTPKPQLVPGCTKLLHFTSAFFFLTCSANTHSQGLSLHCDMRMMENTLSIAWWKTFAKKENISVIWVYFPGAQEKCLWALKVWQWDILEPQSYLGAKARILCVWDGWLQRNYGSPPHPTFGCRLQCWLMTLLMTPVLMAGVPEQAASWWFIHPPTPLLLRIVLWNITQLAVFLLLRVP